MQNDRALVPRISQLVLDLLWGDGIPASTADMVAPESRIKLGDDQIGQLPFLDPTTHTPPQIFPDGNDNVLIHDALQPAMRRRERSQRRHAARPVFIFEAICLT